MFTVMHEYTGRLLYHTLLKPSVIDSVYRSLQYIHTFRLIMLR